MRSRLDWLANKRIRVTVFSWIAAFGGIANQEFLQFPDCFHVRFQIRFRISSNEVADWKPSQFAL